MVVNLILRATIPSSPTWKLVTVATPFYGYAGQVHRWFEGEPFSTVPRMFKQD